MPRPASSNGRRFCPATDFIEYRAEGEPTKFSGYAAVFYDGTAGTEYELWNDRWGRAVERIMPGAFDAVLADKPDVRALFNHDPNHLLGRTTASTLTLGTDARGLQYVILPGETDIARYVGDLLRRKELSGSSFSFTIASERWTQLKTDDGQVNEVREILEFGELFDVGPVTFPAYEATSSEVRSLREGRRPTIGPELAHARALEIEAMTV